MMMRNRPSVSKGLMTDIVLTLSGTGDATTT
jgi:hypothetical protein